MMKIINFEIISRIIPYLCHDYVHTNIAALINFGLKKLSDETVSTS